MFKGLAGDNIYSVSPRHTFKVTRPLLLELYDHVMEVRVWNTKDKLSARARYDRPKAFRLPAPSKGPQQGEGDLPATGQPANLPVVSQDHMRTSKRGKRGGRRSNLNVATAEADSDDLNASIGNCTIQVLLFLDWAMTSLDERVVMKVELIIDACCTDVWATVYFVL